MSALNSFDINKKRARFEIVHADRMLVGGTTGGWISYTPTMTGGSLHASDDQSWRYRIDGTTLYVQGYINHLAAVGGSSASYKLSLPPGCTTRALGSITQVIGSATVSGDSTGGIGAVLLDSTTAFLIAYQHSATTIRYWGDSAASDLKLSAGTAVTMACQLCVELAPTCTALASTYV